jgi:cytochrome P450
VEPSEVTFFDPGTQACPYPSYGVLRDRAPVWQDPMTGHWMVTRYEDVRMILLDTERFSSALPSGRDGSIRPLDPDGHPERARVAARARLLRELFEQHGIGVRAPNLALRDEPEHMQLRRVFDFAFRPRAVEALDDEVEELAYELIDRFLEAGRCDWIAEFAVPLPLYIIGRQLGIEDAELPRIKHFTDAWIRRQGLMQDEDGIRRSVEIEAETRRYFEDHFEQRRRNPDDTLLSLLVNREIPEWGRPMNNVELHTEVMSDILVGGSETTTNALGAGVKLLIQHPEMWRALKADPAGRLDRFIEEVLRLEAPVQGMLRETTVDVELHGVTIPMGSVVHVRFAAANRDERQFARAAEIDLDRRRPRSHLAFGTGTHHCLGAPLARRELYFGFKALVDRIDDLWFIEGTDPSRYRPQYLLRILDELQIGFTPAAERVRTPEKPHRRQTETADAPDSSKGMG